MHKIKIRQHNAVKQKERKEVRTSYNLNFCIALHFIILRIATVRMVIVLPQLPCLRAVCDFSMWSTSKGAVDLHMYTRTPTER